MSKVVAFLQNPYFKNGVGPEIVERYRVDQDFHRQVLRESMTGGLLWGAFGPMFYDIYWDNVSPVASFIRTGTAPEPDLNHVREVIERLRPLVVIAFGAPARQALQKAYEFPWFTLLIFPHPTSFGMNATKLIDFAQLVTKEAEKKNLLLDERVLPSPQQTIMDSYTPPTT